MGTKTCDVCHGMCYLPSGRYESCYSCGGRGYGASTDTSCMACGGSGQSSSEIQDPCWNCSGIGTVTVPDRHAPTTPTKVKAKQSASNKVAKQAGASPSKNSNDTVSETIGGISLLIAGVIGFIFYQDKSELGSSLAVAFVAFIVSGIALYGSILCN